jgi:hypothetical protein
MLITILLLYTILFALYLELNPGLTNIWYRIGSDGERHICPNNLFNFIIKPFTTKELWYFELLDCNYLFGILIIMWYATSNIKLDISL